MFKPLITLLFSWLCLVSFVSAVTTHSIALHGTSYVLRLSASDEFPVQRADISNLLISAEEAITERGGLTRNIFSQYEHYAGRLNLMIHSYDADVVKLSLLQQVVGDSGLQLMIDMFPSPSLGVFELLGEHRLLVGVIGDARFGDPAEFLQSIVEPLNDNPDHNGPSNSKPQPNQSASRPASPATPIVTEESSVPIAATDKEPGGVRNLVQYGRHVLVLRTYPSLPITSTAFNSLIQRFLAISGKQMQNADFKSGYMNRVGRYQLKITLASSTAVPWDDMDTIMGPSGVAGIMRDRGLMATTRIQVYDAFDTQKVLFRILFNSVNVPTQTLTQALPSTTDADGLPPAKRPRYPATLI